LSKVDKKELRAVAEPHGDRSAAQDRWIAAAAADPSGDTRH
jgi:hypothetical protein